jgi:AcrR family transcriptional regulator
VTGGDPGSSRPFYGRRADAERNRESVLDAAVHLLADDPAAGMAEIASASGIGRATLYRHFPTREELLEALVERAFANAEDAIVAARLEEGTTAEALRRMVAGLLSLGDRYRFVFTQGVMFSKGEPDCAREERLGAPIIGLIERGQATGEFSSSLPTRWMAATVGAVIAMSIREAALGRIGGRDLAEDVTHMIMCGISARHS